MGLAVLAFLSGATNSFFASHASQSFGFDVRTAYIETSAAVSCGTFTKFPTAGLITRLTSDVTMVQTCIVYEFAHYVTRLHYSLLGVVLLSVYHRCVSCYFFGYWSSVPDFFLYFMVKKGVSYFALVQVRLDRVNRVLQENLQAVRLVKLICEANMSHRDSKK